MIRTFDHRFIQGTLLWDGWEAYRASLAEPERVYTLGQVTCSACRGRGWHAESISYPDRLPPSDGDYRFMPVVCATCNGSRRVGTLMQLDTPPQPTVGLDAV